jgi:hypothetical protein
MTGLMDATKIPKDTCCHETIVSPKILVLVAFMVVLGPALAGVVPLPKWTA